MKLYSNFTPNFSQFEPQIEFIIMILYNDKRIMWYVWSRFYSHGQKSWVTFAFLGRFPILTGPTPPLTPQTMLDACIQTFFRFPTLHRLGGGRTAIKFRKGCTLLWRNPEITEKCEYCITFSRTFVHDCSLAVREWKQLGLSRWNLLSNTLFSVMLLTILYKVVPTVGSVGEILKRDY